METSARTQREIAEDLGIGLAHKKRRDDMMKRFWKGYGRSAPVPVGPR